MRILKVKGQNLTSLAHFEVDFECPELTQSGVFAITGPTGAGKSTLLDAICLALYGRTPRYGKKKGYDVGRDDLDKDLKISSNDPKNLLRHGTSNGFSEVEFVGCDGQMYRARWEVKRAFNRPTGKIQPETYTLIHITEHGEKNLASDHKSDTKRIIEERVGLNYEQFCRSVFLAQNEFDAFLKADKSDRGTLLQKMTGTEKFAQISRKVYQEFSDAKKELDDMQQKLLSHSILGNQQYEEIKEKLAILKQEISKQKDLVKHISTLQHLFEKKNQCYWEADRIYQKIQQALQNREQREQRKKELLQIEDRVKLQKIYEQINELSSKMAQILKQKDFEQEVYQSLIDQEQAQKEKIERIFAQLQKEEEEYLKLEPQKQRLNLEEQAVVQLEQSLTDLDVSRQQAQKEKQDHQFLYQKSLALKNEYHKNIAHLDQWLKEHQKLDVLIQQKTRIDKMIAEFKERFAKEQSFFSQEGKIDQDVNKIKVLMAKIEPKTLELLNEKQSLQQALDGIAQQSSVDLQSLGEKINLYQSKQQERIQWQNQQNMGFRLLSSIHQALQQFDVNGKEIQVLQGKKVELESQRNKVEGKLELILEEIKYIHDQEELSRYRENLKDGQPCPLCGSVDHPGIQKPSDDLQRLDQRRIALIQENNGVLHEIQKNSDAIKRLLNQNEILLQQLQQYINQNPSLKVVISQLGNDNENHECWGWLLSTELQNKWHLLKQNPSLDQILDLDVEKQAYSLQLLAQSEKALQEELMEKDKEIKALQEQRDLSFQKQQEYHRLSQLLQQKAQEYDVLKKQIDLYQNQIKDIDHQRRLIQADKEQNQALIAQLNLELKSYLVEIQDDLHDEDQVNDLENHIETQINEWQYNKKLLEDKKKAQQSNEEQDKSLEIKQKQLESKVEHYQGLYDKINGDLQLKKQEVAALQGLKQQINQQYQAKENLRNEYHAQNQALNDMIKKTAEQKLLLQENQAKVNQMQGSIDLQQNYLTDGMNRLHIDVQQLQASYQVMSAEELDREIKQLKEEDALAIDGEKQHAENLVLYRNYLKQLNEYIDQSELWQYFEANDEIDLDQLLAQGLSENEMLGISEKLMVRYEQKKEALTLNEHLQIDLSVRLQKHEEKQSEYQNLIKQEQVLAKKVDYLHKLNQAIGSKDGNKFNNFVQSMSLEIVLEVANIHLCELAPRYELMRVPSEELELQLVDIDLGREIRSINGLSGGERFLVSLALALALSTVSSNKVKIESLFIDEGFGTLDPDTLEIALNVLENLQATGRQIGIISHVEGIAQRLGAELRVSPRGAGRSEISVHFMN